MNRIGFDLRSSLSPSRAYLLLALMTVLSIWLNVRRDRVGHRKALNQSPLPVILCTPICND